MKNIIRVAAAFSAALVSVNAATTVIGFDELTEGDVVDNQYIGSGVVFDGLGTVFTDGSLLNPDFPSFSAGNVLINDLSSILRMDFSVPVQAVSARITATSSVKIFAYDSLGAELDSDILLSANYIPVGTPNFLLSVSSGSPISYVTVVSSDLVIPSFTLDDFTFTTPATGVPDQGSAAMALVGGLVGILTLRRRAR